MHLSHRHHLYLGQMFFPFLPSRFCNFAQGYQVLWAKNFVIHCDIICIKLCSVPTHRSYLALITELYYISGDRAPDRKVSPKTWRILRHKSSILMMLITDHGSSECGRRIQPPPPRFYGVYYGFISVTLWFCTFILTIYS